MSDGAGTVRGASILVATLPEESFTGGVGTGGVYHFDVGNSPIFSDFTPPVLTLNPGPSHSG